MNVRPATMGIGHGAMWGDNEILNCMTESCPQPHGLSCSWAGSSLGRAHVVCDEKIDRSSSNGWPEVTPIIFV